MMFTPWDPEAYMEEWRDKLRTLNEDIEGIALYMSHFKLDKRRKSHKMLYAQYAAMILLSSCIENRLEEMRKELKRREKNGT